MGILSKNREESFMPFAVNAVVVGLTFLLTQYLFKPLIGLWINPTDSKYNTVVRTSAIVCAVVLIFVSVGVFPTGNGLLILLGNGILSGLSAVGVYSVGREFTQPK